MYDVFPYIEPCCYQKQLPEVFRLAKTRGMASYLSNSDWTLSLLLEWLCWAVPSGVLTLCLIHIKPETLEKLDELLRRTIYSHRKRETVPLISRLELITRGDEREDTERVLGEYIREGRVETVSYGRIGFRCVMITDPEDMTEKSYVVQGSLNQERMNALQMVTIESGRAPYMEIHKVIGSIIKTKS